MFHSGHRSTGIQKRACTLIHIISQPRDNRHLTRVREQGILMSMANLRPAFSGEHSVSRCIPKATKPGICPMLSYHAGLGSPLPCLRQQPAPTMRCKYDGVVSAAFLKVADHNILRLLDRSFPQSLTFCTGPLHGNGGMWLLSKCFALFSQSVSQYSCLSLSLVSDAYA